MARESKRKRDEQRFGKPERLADLIVATPVERWVIPTIASDPGNDDVSEWCGHNAQIMHSGLKECAVFDGTSVLKYYWEHPKEKWLIGDFPNVAPPFPAFFIESRKPASVDGSGKTDIPDSQFPEQWGIFFTAYRGPESISFDGGDGNWITLFHVGENEWCLNALMAMTYRDRRVRIAPIMIVMHVGENGTMITRKMIAMRLNATAPKGMYAGLARVFKSLLDPSLFVLSMLHCKNVTVNPVEPDVKINRERRKSGLKPFVRYNTINIEPMKKLLRTEGQVETQGLRRALHICRGHFATYSEDKPLFGKVSGTFWKEAHVRGSGNEGNVISDYRVNAPSPNLV